MASTKNTLYKVFNGTDWDTLYFKTVASQVSETTGLRFLRPSTNIINGKSFFDGENAQEIILYATDIKLNSANNKTIYDKLGEKFDTIGGGISGNVTIGASGAEKDLTVYGDLAVTGSFGIRELDVTNRMFALNVEIENSLIYKGYDVVTFNDIVTTSKNGLMSKEDKTRLDNMYSIWGSEEDSDTLVNKVTEVLAAFESFSEGGNVASLLANKLDKTGGGTISGDLTVTNSITTTNLKSTNILDVSSLKIVSNGEIKIGDGQVRAIFQQSTEPTTGMRTGDILLQY